MRTPTFTETFHPEVREIRSHLVSADRDFRNALSPVTFPTIGAALYSVAEWRVQLAYEALGGTGDLFVEVAS